MEWITNPGSRDVGHGVGGTRGGPPAAVTGGRCEGGPICGGVGRCGRVRESFTYMSLRKLPVTHMSWKSFQIIVCHALKIR
jgi:hypothetical protein